jgi:serine/threonine protein kinase
MEDKERRAEVSGGASLRLPSGYTSEEKLYESDTTLVVRGQRAADRLPIVFKVLKARAASQEMLGRFRHELTILAGLDLPHVIKADGSERSDGRHLLLLEDRGGESLDRILKHGALSPAAFIPLANTVTAAVGGLRQKRIVHKNLNPSNIIWKRHRGEVRPIDFGIACEMSCESQGPQPPTVIGGGARLPVCRAAGNLHRGQIRRAAAHGGLRRLGTARVPTGSAHISPCRHAISTSKETPWLVLPFRCVSLWRRSSSSALGRVSVPVSMRRDSALKRCWSYLIQA